MKKSKYRFIMAIVYLIVGAFALAISFGAFNVKVEEDQYIFFTIIINYSCYAYMALELIYNIYVSIKHNRLNYLTILPETKFCLTTSIFVNFTIANTILGGKIGYIWTTGYWVNPNNIFFHFVLPILFVINYFYYSDHRYTFLTPFKQLIFPALYLAMLLIRGTILKWNETDINIIPYEFLNPRIVGYPQAIFSIFGVIALFVLIGFMVMFIDKYLKNKEFRKEVKDSFIDENDDEN